MFTQMGLVFLLYFIIILAIGVAAYLKTSNYSDYILGGRSLNSLVTALGVGASDMSGWLMIALPGAVYVAGLSEIWMPIGLCIGALCNWLCVGNRLRVFTIAANKALTIPAYLQYRFQDESGVLRLITALVVLLFFTVYSAANFKSGALLFSTGFAISYHNALMLSVVVIVLYTAIGGFLAVNWVDVFQGTLMLFALLLLPSIVLWQLWHVPEVFHASLRLIPASYYNITSGVSVGAIVSTLAWGLGYFGQPHILVRFMAARSAQAIKRGTKIAMTWMVLALAGAVCIGIAGKLYFIRTPLVDPETVFLALTEQWFSVIMQGVLFAAVLSCVMSTVAAQLILSSSAIAEDLYRAYLQPNASDKTLLWVGRLTVLFVALVATSLAWGEKSQTIMKLVENAWGGLGASFGPIILFSLFFRRTTRIAAISGIVVGASTCMLWVALRYCYPTQPILQLYELVPAFFTSLLVIYVISLLDKANQPALVQWFDAVEAKYRTEL